MKTDLRVLVLEDQDFLREIAVHLLADLGVGGSALLEAANASSALELLKSQKIAPDLMLVDLNMPGMDGIEFLSHVARLRLTRNVALVSAADPSVLNTVQAMAASYGLNIIGVVEKPLSLRKLSEILRAPLMDWDPPVEASFEPVDENALRAAVAQGRIEPWFQLQVDMATGQPKAVEALARWKDGERILLPESFIEPLERLGLAQMLTESILEQACEWKRTWHKSNAIALGLSVNISPTALGDSRFVDRVVGIVDRHGLQASEIVFELTESSVLADTSSGLQTLARLRLKGFGLAIDDFGVGYSSLSCLSQLPFTELKIDREFVSGVVDRPRKAAVVEASLQLARSLGMTAVAEGIEDMAQWQRMAQLGCDLAQGDLISHPVPGSELPAAIAQWRQRESLVGTAAAPRPMGA